MRVWFILLGICFSNMLCAQQQRESDEKIISDILERLVENTEGTIDYTDLQDQLAQYNKNKINLNRASRDQLQRLFFLDDGQVNAIIQHRIKFGDFISLYELQSIEQLDDLTIYYLTYFVSVDEDWQADQTSFKEMIRKGKHELITLLDTELQQREGYTSARKLSGNSYYFGNQQRHVVRYRFSYGNRLQFGYNAETDMGETYTPAQKTPGFDFNSAHFYYRPRKGILKTVALGDYQINFGQGLAFGSGLAARKSAFALNVRRSYAPIRPYRSLNENEFLRGASVLLVKGNWQLVMFGSGKYLSTSLSSADTILSEDFFSSISLGGLHRTSTELAKKSNVFQVINGGNLQYKWSSGLIGITHVQTSYDVAFKPGTQPYQRYNFSGTRLANTGINYQWQWRNFNFFGEYAMSNNRAKAFTTGFNVSLDANLDVVVLYRNFAPNYQITYNNPFAENTDGRNERGIYTGLSFRFNRKWLLNAYFDMYKSPWLRYLVDGSGNGVDALAELQYNPSKTAQVYVRVRHEYKTRNQANNLEKVDYLSYQNRTVFRVNTSYKMGLNLSAKTRAEQVLYHDELSGKQYGMLLFQDVSWNAARKKVSLITRVAYFTVEDYNARVYAAENDVLYQYSVPLYQNSGVRYYAVVRFKVNRKVELWAKYSSTHYANVSTISSGLEQIKGNTVSDLRLQLRVIL